MLLFFVTFWTKCNKKIGVFLYKGRKDKKNMNELKIGAMSNEELGAWFGVKVGTFKNQKKKKLEELKMFADFYLDKGKVIITEIYDPIYSKKQSETMKKVVDKIDMVWSEDGLDSCSRVGSEIYELLKQEDSTFNKAESTVVKYTAKGRNELYGVPFVGNGKIGSCIYIWCKRNKDTGEYSFLTEEEQMIKQQLQTKYFGDATEKQILVKGMVESGEIRKEDAWQVLEDMTNMGTGNFMMFLKEIQRILGCQVVRGTLVDRNAFMLDSEENKTISM